MGAVPPKPPAVFSAGRRPLRPPSADGTYSICDWLSSKQLVARQDAIRKTRANNWSWLAYEDFNYLDDPADIVEWGEILVRRRKARTKQRVVWAGSLSLVLVLSVVALAGAMFPARVEVSLGVGLGVLAAIADLVFAFHGLPKV